MLYYQLVALKWRPATLKDNVGMQSGFGEKHLDKPKKGCYIKELWR
jgi:hypothetical protein